MDFKQNRKSLFLWCIGMIFFLFAGMGEYSVTSLSENAINDMVEMMPKMVKVIFGFGEFDYSKAIGYYAMIFVYIIWMGAIHAVFVGTNVIAKEEIDRTYEFLYVKPISRIKVLWSKVLSGLIQITFLNIIIILNSLWIVSLFGKGQSIYKEIILFNSCLLLIQLVFFSLGVFVASINKRSKQSATIAMAIVLVLYILGIFTDLYSPIVVLKVLTPFKYFSLSKITIDLIIPLIPSVSLVIVSGLFLIGGTFFFNQRDLK